MRMRSNTGNLADLVLAELENVITFPIHGNVYTMSALPIRHTQEKVSAYVVEGFRLRTASFTATRSTGGISTYGEAHPMSRSLVSYILMDEMEKAVVSIWPAAEVEAEAGPRSPVRDMWAASTQHALDVLHHRVEQMVKEIRG